MEKIQLFENQKIRTVWDEEKEEWYFSIVDVVGVLSESVDGRKYWNKLKQRLKELVQKDIDLGIKIIINGRK